MFTIIANWKMNGSFEMAVDYADALAEFYEANPPSSKVVICPPAPYLVLMDGPFAIGGQNCHSAEKGAFTGEVAAPLLADCGCEYVLLGHSERRAAGETDQEIDQKAKAAQLAGLKTIVCVGEKEGEDFARVVERQLEFVDYADFVAYEPVWAIGTGKTPTADEIEQRHNFIIDKTSKPVIYGGSVNSENAEDISKIAGVSGLLVGGASLDVENFIEMIKSVENMQ